MSTTSRETNLLSFEVLNCLDDPIAVLDKDGCVVMLNPAAEQAVGRTTAEATGQPCTEVLGLAKPACRDLVALAYKSGPAGREVACTPCRAESPSMNVRVKPVALGDGFKGVLFFFGDAEPLEKRYEDVLSGSPVLLFEAAVDGRLTYGASQFIETLGCADCGHEELSLFDLVSENQEQSLRTAWDQAKGGRRILGLETRFRTGEDKPRPFWVSLFPVTGRDGEVTGIRGAAGDLVAQKSLAYALEAAEERFTVIFRESSDPILILSMGGEFLSANPAFERISGVRSEELFRGTKTWADFLVEEDIAPIRDSIIRCAKSGEDNAVEFRICTEEGQVLWFEQSHSVLHDADGIAKGIMAVARDVSRHKEQEEQLLQRAADMQHRHQRAQTLVSKLKAFFTRVSALPTDIEAFVNGVCLILAEMYDPLRVAIVVRGEKTRVYFAGAALPEGLALEDGSAPISAMSKQVIETSLPFYCNTLDETDVFADDPLVKAMDLKTYLGAPLRDSAGKVRGTLAILDREERALDSLDVELVTVAGLHVAARLRAEESEEARRQLEEHLRQAQKMEAVGMLAGGIAHDFNNILSGILGFSSFLLSKAEEGTDLHSNLALIEQSAMRAADLTRQLLAFSRRKHFAKQPACMNQIIGEVLSLLQRSLDKGIVIRQDLAEDLPNVLGDPGQLNQVIMNLCLNAADAMRERGGALRIKTAHRLLTQRERQVFVDAGPGEYVCITVSDSGEGMPQDVLDHLFDPFFTTKAERGGTGLGLSIVYGIVTNHGGDITVESKENKGTVFKLYLPVHRGEARTEEKTTPLQLQGNETILVVDDEMIVRQMATAVLKEYGYKVLMATSGHEAVEHLRALEGKVHMVLLDMVMPGMDGEATFHALREVDPDVPVLLTSGFTGEGRSNRLIEEGAKGLIHKPYKSEELATRVREVLSETIWT